MGNWLHQRFEPVPAAISEARLMLHAALGPHVAQPTVEELAVVVSELATNAVRHARSPFSVSVEVDGYVRVEVEDHSLETPTPRVAAPTDAGGRGLTIIDAFCDRWGTEIEAHTKCVWCERDLS
jgi:anti-sigma regulatory factor (Ser/Thr protein kinase)